MKITIDTKHDSHEEIKQAIRMLSSLVDGKKVYTNSPGFFDNPTPSPEPTNLFDNPSSSEPQPDVSGMMSLFDDPEPAQPETKEEPQDKPQLEFF